MVVDSRYGVSKSFSVCWFVVTCALLPSTTVDARRRLNAVDNEASSAVCSRSVERRGDGDYCPDFMRGRN